MDLGDLFSLPVPAGRRRRSTPGEHLAAGVGIVGFPTLVFLIVLFGGLYDSFVAAMIVLPLAFTGAAFLLSRYLQNSPRATAEVTLGCALLCALASAAASLLGTIGSILSGF